MDVAIYARVSSDKQDVELSLSAQLKAIKEYAAKNGHRVKRTFLDEAESGRTANRPAFKEMVALARLKNPPFEAILVWKFNRFSRNRADSVTYKTLLRSRGIDVISINEPVDESPAGQLLEGMIESIDEFYSANMGQDIKRGMRENASRGFFNGSRPPYGFERVPVRDGSKVRHHLTPEPEGSTAVHVVRRMFELASGDHGCKEIAKLLNVEGIRTSTGRRWGCVTVHKVLTNEAYKGTLVWGGRAGHPAAKSGEPPVRVEGAWPAIVEEATFDLVRKKLNTRRPSIAHPRTVGSRYLLSGMIFCRCGRALTGRSAKSGRHFYYSCSRAAKQGKVACGSRALPKEKIERLIVDQLRRRVLTEENLNDLIQLVEAELKAEAKGKGERLRRAEQETREVEARLDRLYWALETGKLELEDLAPRIKQLRGQLDELDNERVRIETKGQMMPRIDGVLVKAYADEVLEHLGQSESTEARAFLRSFVKRVDVDGDVATIRYTLPLPPEGSRIDSVTVLPTITLGGDRGTRTPNLGIANAALSQLSYIPTWGPSTRL